MNRRWLVPLLFTTFATNAIAAPRFERKEMAVPGGILWLSRGDLDGDGLVDLVLSYRRGSGPKSRRFIAVFFRNKDGFSKEPDVAIEAPQAASVIDTGDALGDGKDQLVYIAADGVHAISFTDRKPGNHTRIVTVASLVAEPEEDDLVAWDFLRPLSGPGSPPVLIIPTRGPLRLFRREADAVWKPWSRVSIDQYSSYDAEIATFRRDRRGGSTGRPYSFRVTTIVPVFDLLDQTGDGKVDLITSYEDRIAIYPQLDDGTISTRPSHSIWFGVRSPEEMETRDSGVSSAIQDLDGDGIADACVNKISGGITTLATKTYLFRGVKGGGFEPKPAQVFEDEGFAALPQFIDVDGDGKLEMVHPHSEVSIMGISQMMLSKELTLGLRIRRASSERPAFFEKSAVQSLETVYGLDLSVGATLRGIFPIFGHDFDGDGLRDAILSQGASKMLMHRGVKKDGELFEPEGRVTLSAQGTSTTIALFPDTKSAMRPDVLMYYVDRADLAGKLVLFRNENQTQP